MNDKYPQSTYIAAPKELRERVAKAISVALNAYVPGGSNARDWLVQNDDGTPHENARTVVECMIKALDDKGLVVWNDEAWECVAYNQGHQDGYGELAAVVKDLAILLRRIAYRHGKGLPIEKSIEGGIDYLQRKNLNGSPLRESKYPLSETDKILGNIGCMKE